MAEVDKAWSVIDGASLDYHLNQFDRPKESTIWVANHLRKMLLKHQSKNVLDLAGGAGGPASYYAQLFKDIEFKVIDISQELLDLGRSKVEGLELANLRFQVGDIYTLPQERYSGVVLSQTISWLPDYKIPLKNIFASFKPDFLIVTGLFYNGCISCKTQVTEGARNDREVFYNTYSVPDVAKFVANFGYEITENIPFDISVDLPLPSDPNVMQTYTLKIPDPNPFKINNLQISGPILMNWQMLIFEQMKHEQKQRYFNLEC